MAGFRLRSRRAGGSDEPLEPSRDPDLLTPHLEDAAHFPGNHTSGLLKPTSESQVAAALRSCRSILPIGAQSSLTDGATPMGEVLLSTARLNRIEPIRGDSVRVEADVTLQELEAALTAAGKYYPPAPTYPDAFVGGTVATNAAGAATFKYGATRQWVEALTVVLPDGDVLDIQRGDIHAHPDGYFELELAARTARVPIPTYAMPRVAKLSAGYFAEPGMDLIDLFIGSEGTLGVITAVTLRVLPVLPAFALALVPFARSADAMACVHALRAASISTWRTHDSAGIDVSAIEHMDARCLALLREDGIDRVNGVSLPDGTAIALLITLELPA